MLPPEKPTDEQAQPRGSISPPLFGPLLPALFCLRSHVLRRDRRPAGDLLAVMIGVLSHALASYPPRSLRHHGLCTPSWGRERSCTSPDHSCRVLASCSTPSVGLCACWCCRPPCVSPAAG